MKFIRRHDLAPHTHIAIVKRAWFHQGVYGKMTQIAQEYHISRTFLSQLTWAAQHQLETLLSNPQPLDPDWPSQLEPLMLLGRLEGQGSLPSLSSILKRLEYRPSSVGSLSASLQASGRSVPSPLSMPDPKVVGYLSDEIVAIRRPILVTIEAQSTAILTIEPASDRSAQTWQAHCEDLGAHRFHRIGMVSDRGVGLTAGQGGSSSTRLRYWPRSSWCEQPFGGKKWPPAIPVPQMRQGLAMIVHEALQGGMTPHLITTCQKRLQRTELARLSHWKRRKRLGPLN